LSSTIQNGGTPGMNGIAAMTSAKMKRGSRWFIAVIASLLDRGRCERAQHQHGKDQRKDDDLLEITGIERGERLDAADDQAATA
jgi:hypothetical protein